MSSSSSGISMTWITAITRLLMRLAQTSSQFTDNENAYEIEKAINKIVANDPANIYKKLKIEIKDDTGYAQSA